jgi:hypothetical protein
MKLMRWIYPQLETEAGINMMKVCFGFLMLSIATLVGCIIAVLFHSVSTPVAAFLLRTDLILFGITMSLAVILAQLELLPAPETD